VQGGAEHGLILVKPTLEGFIEHNKTLGRFLICNFSFNSYTMYHHKKKIESKCFKK
jgi:hypothetical protein